MLIISKVFCVFRQIGAALISANKPHAENPPTRPLFVPSFSE